MLLLVVLVLAAAIICMGYCRRQRANFQKLPPGPPGVPLLGNIPQITKNAPKKFSQWAAEYGPLYTVHFANQPALVVSDINLMKQLFGTLASTGKFSNELIDSLMEGPHGIFSTEGKEWLEQRQFLANTLKTFKFQNSSMIFDEIDTLCSRLEVEMQENGKVHLAEMLKESAGGTIWAVSTGKRITAGIARLLEEFIQISQVTVRTGLVFFPWLKYLAPKWSGYTETRRLAKELNDLVAESFEEHKLAAGKMDFSWDIVSAYRQQMQDMRDKPNSTFYGELGITHSVKSILGLLIAGIETTASTINWLIFYLCAHPEIQRKVQKEIDEVIGEGEVTLEDRHRMPYLEAVILETLRSSSTVPFGLIHKLLEDVSITGYCLPKGLFLIANIYHVHNDPNIWGDPENFLPERFLEDAVEKEGHQQVKREIKKNNLREHIASFQPGRRSCVGEPVARDIMFLFAVKLFQNYNFLVEEGKNESEYLEPNAGMLLIAKNLGVRVLKRNR